VALGVVKQSTANPLDVSKAIMAELPRIKDALPDGMIVNNGYDGEMARRAVASGAADLVAFGKAFIANPDLVRRLREDAPLNVPQRDTFYGGGAAGYTDYPTLETSVA